LGIDYTMEKVLMLEQRHRLLPSSRDALSAHG
jgi:hypothetical protein